MNLQFIEHSNQPEQCEILRKAEMSMALKEVWLKSLDI